MNADFFIGSAIIVLSAALMFISIMGMRNGFLAPISHASAVVLSASLFVVIILFSAGLLFFKLK